MNALFMLSYMLATLLCGQVAMAQEQVSFQLQLDPILLVAGSESRDLEPRNIDALLKIKWEFAQAKKGYTHFGGSYELIDMPTDYHRFALEGGYTFNQLFDYLKIQEMFDSEQSSQRILVVQHLIQQCCHQVMD